MHDLPNATRPFLNYNGNPANKYKRELNFTLMLTAIEENSGKMIVLTELKWTNSIQLKIDTSKPYNCRLIAEKYKTTCTYNNSNIL